MRPHRVVERVLIGAAVAAAAAAPRREPHRMVAVSSRPALAPRRRGSAAKKLVPTVAAADTPNAPTAAGTVRGADAVAPPSEGAAASDAPPSQPAATAALATVTAASDGGRTQASTPPRSGDSSTSSSSVRAEHGRTLAQQRLHVTKLHHGLLLRVHRALQGDAGRDGRARRPHLTLETLQRVHPDGAEESSGGSGSSSNGAPAVTVDPVKWTVSLAPPDERSVPAHAPLSTEEALRLFANAFGVTLHTTSLRRRALVSVSAAPSPPLLCAPAPATPAAASLPLHPRPPPPPPQQQQQMPLSFLASPMAVRSAPVAASAVWMQRTVVEETATLRWLEHSFVELCERHAAEIHGGPADAVHASVRSCAAALVQAVEDASRASNGPALQAMRRQRRQDAAAAAGGLSKAPTAVGSRRRQTARPPKDMPVEDTLQNTVERLGQLLHLVHMWLIHLCTDASESQDASGGGAAAAAAVVARVAQRALRWAALRSAPATAAPTRVDVQWLLAVALLEHLHTSTHSFHHLRSAGDATDEAGQTVTAHRLRGLAALIDFAMAQRVEPVTLPFPPARGSRAFQEAVAAAQAGQREALTIVLAVYHALLPTYATLLPPYQHYMAVAEAQAPESLRGRSTESMAPEQFVLDDGDGGAAPQARQPVAPPRTTATATGGDVNKTHQADADAPGGRGGGSAAAVERAERCIAAASPLRVWDVVVMHFEKQDAYVRSEGAVAAVWWLQVLSLWVNTATQSLQLSIVLASSASGDVAAPAAVLLSRAAAALRCALRFNQSEYERRCSARQTQVVRHTGMVSGVTAAPPPSSTDVDGDAGSGGNDAAGGSSSSAGGRDGTATATGGHGAAVRDAGETNEAHADGSGVDGEAEESSDAPLPLRRQRGKRSLFYKTPTELASTAARSRFELRGHRHRRGTTATSPAATASSSNDGSGAAGAAGAGAAGAAGAGGADVSLSRHARAVVASERHDTSAVFDVLVLSTDASALLSHTFRVDDMQREQWLEEAWAATAHAHEELWCALYALPPAAGAAGAVGRRAAAGHVTALLRNALPPATAALLDAGTTAASPAPAEALRRVHQVLQDAQGQLGLHLFESLRHVLVAVSQVLLRIERLAAAKATNAAAAVAAAAAAAGGAGSSLSEGRRAPLHHAWQRHSFHSILAIGAAILLGGNTVPWDCMQARWQQLQLQRHPTADRGDTARRAWVVTDELAVQCVRASARELATLHLTCRQHADITMANAHEMLRLLRATASPSSAAPLPLLARQVMLATVLRSLSVLAGQWRHRSDAAQKGYHLRQASTLHEVSRDGAVELCDGVLALLREDAPLRLICCYPNFLGELLDAHTRLRADHAALVQWADTYLLPTALTAVVAGLQCSHSTHNSATHAALCESTLALLSQVSRYAANPHASVVDVVRTPWNMVLLQVSLYTIRTAGRGGPKRAPDHGLPPATLPSLTDLAGIAREAAGVAAECMELLRGGGEATLLALLGNSSQALVSSRGLQQHTDAVTAVMVARLTAYIDAWETQVRFSPHGPGRNPPSSHTPAAARDVRSVLAQLQATHEAVGAHGDVAGVARLAGDAATPFLASNPTCSDQLGFLVRFLEQHLRVQEHLSRFSDEEVATLPLPAPHAEPTAAAAAAAAAVPAAASSPALGTSAVSTLDVTATAPLVLLDFVGYLSHRSAWAMLTWACTMAETVVRIELKRHRSVPAPVREVATTAILSQLRAVPPPQRGEGKPPVNVLRAIVSLSDLVATANETLLGYHRRSALRGLLSDTTRDQYRVTVFGLKQAVAHVVEEARQYSGASDGAAAATAATATAAALDAVEEVDTAATAGDVNVVVGASGPRLHADGTIDRTWLAAGVAGLPAPPREQDVGLYYVKAWAAYAAEQHVRIAASGTGPADAATEAALLPYRRTELNREFRFFMSCLVCLVDADMEAVLQLLHRMHGDGEDDVRLVVEATVCEICRTVSAVLQSMLLLAPDVRQACCKREEAELLWASLCIVATISVAVARDAQERFFTTRCQDAIDRVCSMTQRLIDNVVAGAAPAHRPLATALVRGAQLLLRDPHSSQRLAIRLAVRQRECDDLSAVLSALTVLLQSSSQFKPGRRVLHLVWSRVAAELVQPLPLQPHSPAGDGDDAAPCAANVVSSLAEYKAVLRGLATVCAAPDGDGVSIAATAAAAAASHIVEDAASVQAARRQSLRASATAENWGRGGMADADGDETAAGGAGFSRTSPLHPGQDTAAELHAFSVAEALESGTLPVSTIVDTVIAHAAATARAAGGRSSRDRHPATGADDRDEWTAAAAADDPAAPVGFPRLVRELVRHMTELLSLVPLWDVVARPQSEAMFGCLGLLHGHVSAAAEDRLWALMAAKWTAELMDPCESLFKQLQAAQLAQVTELRSVMSRDAASPANARARGSDAGAGAGAERTNATVFDAFAPSHHLRVHWRLRSSASGLSMAAAADRAMWGGWCPEPLDLRREDDTRVLTRPSSGDDTSSPTMATEVEPHATGLAALAAMPPPLPIAVVLTLLKVLQRRSLDGGHTAATGSFSAFADVFLTHTARTYWLLRPRLADSAWVVLATMEKSLSAFPADTGVRKREWERVCRQWRVPVRLDHAHAAAGLLFTDAQRRHVTAWSAALRRSAGDADTAAATATAAEPREDAEVAVVCYLQAMALFLHLLSMTLQLLARLDMVGDLSSISVEAVRRRVLAQALQRQPPNEARHGDDGGVEGRNASQILSSAAVRMEMTSLATSRQTQAHLVNRNLFEGATLQLLNVVWCLVRHADSLTHRATDAAVSLLQAGRSSSSAAAVVSYTDHIRDMVVSVVQDTLDMVTSVGGRTPTALPQQAVQTLLCSGFSCEVLQLQRPSSAAGAAGRRSDSAASHAPAPTVLAAHLSTFASAASSGATSTAVATGSARAGVGVLRQFDPAARPELFVGSPTLLAILHPPYMRGAICRSLESRVASATLLPIAAALEFYLSRQGAPLAPLLDATTELLTVCTYRNSAVHMYCERLAGELTTRSEFRQALAPPTIASAEQGAAGSISNEVVIAFLAAIARSDVQVTKKTLAHLLHSVMRMRLDVFGQPPTQNRQGKLTLVQVGTTVDTAIDTTNPLYTPAPAATAAATTATAAAAAGGGTTQPGSAAADNSGSDSATVMDAFGLERWSDATAATHRRALAALTIALPTVVEVAMHMSSMRTLDASERRRAIQMLKAAEEERRERVAVHRSQAQVAASPRPAPAAPGTLDASLHLEDPFDFGVALLHLRYALRKIVHACLRRRLHQQGPRILGDVAWLLKLVDPALQQASTTTTTATPAERPRPFDGVLTGTTRVLLSRAVLCAQAIGYDSTGAALEMPPLSGVAGAKEGLPVLKLPVPALQPSAVAAAISSATAAAAASAPRRGRHAAAGHSTGKIGLLTKEEKATVHQRVEHERDAATTVGLTTAPLPAQSALRIARALRFTRQQEETRRRQLEFRQRRAAEGHGSGASTGLFVAGSVARTDGRHRRG